MRKSDILIGFLIAVVFLLAAYYFVKTYQTLQDEKQLSQRPTVEETLRNQPGNSSAKETADLNTANDAINNGTVNSTPKTDNTDVVIGRTAEDGEADYNDSRPTADEMAALNEIREKETASDRTPDDYNRLDESQRPFLVVGGTFKQMVNAEQQLARVRQLGYTEAAIGKFNRAAYASLIVDRFATAAEAKALVRTLKSEHGIEAYVHKKR